MKRIIISLKFPLVLFLLLCIFITNFIVKTSNLQLIKPQVLSATTDFNQQKLVLDYSSYRAEKLVDNYYLDLTLEEKVGQLFMMSIQGFVVNDEIRSLVNDYNVGGIVLMSGNIGSKSQLPQLKKEIDDLSEIQILYAVDQEGGSVARIPWDEAMEISQHQLSIMDRDDFAYEVGLQHAESIKELSIDMNLAPVLDIAFTTDSVMFYRSLGDNPYKVTRLALQLINSHQSLEILTCAKHYPGIGRTATDSHEMLPVINISRETLMKEELIPFIAAINSDIPAIMTGHAMYPEIDSENPSSLSQVFITDILKEELEFEGLVISDDLGMNALVDYPNRLIQAINSGTDMILLVDSYKNQVAAIEQLKKAIANGEISEERLEQSVKKVIGFKITYLDMK